MTYENFIVFNDMDFMVSAKVHVPLLVQCE